jgi:hypothetical protein
MYMPVPLFLESGKRKEKFPHDILLLSTFDFEPIALRLARIRESSLVKLMEEHMKRNHDFSSRMNGENKRKQIAQKKRMVEIIIANR